MSDSNKKKYLVIHGPNLNLLGKREPEIYGTMSLDDINAKLNEFANQNNIDLEIIQSNSEGEIIDALHNAMENSNGVVINPGAYTHYSIAIFDAVSAIGLPVIEVHISNIYSREEFRRHSVIAPACIGQITGLGWYGYILALESIIKL
ncbi:MAG: type II 3-dehydroquinate dehydratase [candidate division Zixibacteria bacterium]|nr:type II 3-dehydroquinate dehydratase [candidate division Zixibacteria bacterium]